MPVPVTSTGAHVHISQQANSHMQTEGPFERAARLKREAEATAGQGSSAEPHKAARGAPPASQTASSSQPAQGQEKLQGDAIIDVNNLSFCYPGLDGKPIPNQPPLIENVSFKLPAGSRCLLLGSNGAGKTTFLKLLGGKHMVPPESIKVLGKPPFHSTELVSSGDLTYVGGNWTRDVAFAGYSIPLAGDFPARRMIDAVQGVDSERKERLIKVLDIDPDWRMHQVSDGQRRRVQICVGLLKPFKVLLLDEVTVDLDVLGRADLLRFLQEECETRGCTIIYATHIFDGLEFWPTHLAYLSRGQNLALRKADEVPELKQGRLLDLVFGLLTAEQEQIMKARGPRPVEWDPSQEGKVADFSYSFNNGWTPGTLSSTLKSATNAVMR